MSPSPGAGPWGWGDRGRLWASGAGSPGAVWEALDDGRGAGGARLTGRVAPRALASQLAVASAPTTSTALSQHYARASAGGKPLTGVDYLAVQAPEARLLEQLGKGLYEGAKQANITIAGGELAQIGKMIRGVCDGYTFDLAATCVGTVPLDRILVGQHIEEGDV